MAEQRLIDANALKIILKAQADIVSLCERPEIAGGFLQALDFVKAAPTIDAAPVVHARWLPRGSDDNDAGMYYCSACKDERYFGDEVITSEEASKYGSFCPCCGAKMDGGIEG